MTRKIYKYPLVVTDQQVVQIPDGADLLTIQPQHDVAVLWAIVDLDQPVIEQKIRCIGTGNPMFDDEEAGYYLATTQHPYDLAGSTQGGIFVAHWFADYREPPEQHAWPD